MTRGGGGVQGNRGDGSGSTDPLLEMPEELSAVLTLKRGVQIRGGTKRGAGSSASTVSGVVVEQSTRKLTTPLLKRKRESIV